jgi:hypothetical protein
VKLNNPAIPNTVGSGVDGPVFANIKVSDDGLTIDFKNPLNPDGIGVGEVVSIGWQDALADVVGKVVQYWWTDADGNTIGEVHNVAPGDNSLSIPPPGFFGPSGLLGTDDITDGGPVGINDPGPSGDNPSGLGGDPNNPPGGPNTPPADASVATPEPGSLLLLGSALLGIAASGRRRSR